MVEGHNQPGQPYTGSASRPYPGDGVSVQAHHSNCIPLSELLGVILLVIFVCAFIHGISGRTKRLTLIAYGYCYWLF